MAGGIKVNRCWACRFFQLVSSYIGKTTNASLLIIFYYYIYNWESWAMVH